MAKTPTAYDELIERIADARPFGFGHSGDVSLDPHQLAIVLTNQDVIDALSADTHLIPDMIDALGSRDESEAGYKFLRYADSYAKSQVFEDVRYLLTQREEAETIAAEAARDMAPEHGMRASDF